MSDSSTSTLLAQAKDLHRQSRLDEARAAYEAVLAGTPDHGEALQFLGVLERHAGNPVRAIELLLAAGRQGPLEGGDVSLRNAIEEAIVFGNEAVMRGDGPLAINAFQTVLKARPGTRAAQANLLTTFNALCERIRLPKLYEMFGLLAPMPPAPVAGRVIDTFLFFDELDILEIRLNELAPVVDRFVLVEATRTHLGDPKPLIFQENRARFAAFADRLTHIVVEDLPDRDSPWFRENHQRECLAQGLEDLGAGDVVLISDIDEIPRASAVAEARRHLLAGSPAGGSICVFAMYDHYFRLNYRNAGERSPRTVGVRGDRFHLATPQIFRHLRLYADVDGAPNRYPHPFHVLAEAGWHFSFQADNEGVARMFARMLPHSGIPVPRPRPDEVDAIIAERRRIFRPNERWTIDPPTTLPAHVQANLDRFAVLPP